MAPTPLAGSMKKWVLLMPAQVRLPGLRRGAVDAVGRGDLEAEAPGVLAGAGRKRPRARRIGGRLQPHAHGAHLVARHGVHRLAGQQPAAAGLPAIEDQLDEARVVAGGAVQAAVAPHHHRQRRGIGHLDQPAVGPLVHGHDAGVFRHRHVEGRFHHAERTRQPVLQERVDALAGHHLDDVAEHARAGAVVPALPRLADERQLAVVGGLGGALRHGQSRDPTSCSRCPTCG